MQVSVETISDIGRRMTIGVPADKIDGAVNQRLQEAARTIRLNGFRPGKVPMAVVRKRYGTSVRQEVLGEVMRDSYIEALQTESLKPAGYPKLKPLADEAGKDFEFTAEFEIYPEPELADLSQISVTRQQADITDDDVNEMIEVLRKQKVKWVEAEREAQQGDRLNIDFKGTKDGELFEGGSAEKQPLELGSNRMIPGFEDGLLGVKAGEQRTLELTFPDDYHSADLAGQAVAFEVTVHNVEMPELPEVDAEFMKEYGIEEADEAAFRAEILKNMQREAKQAIDNKVKQSVIDQLLAANQFDIPKALIDQEIHTLKHDAVRQFGGAQMDPHKLPDELFKDQAEKRVKTGLVFAQLIEDFDIKVEESAVRTKVEEMAATYQDAESVIEYFMNNAEQRQQLEGAVMEELVVEAVLGKGTVTEQTVSYKEALQPAAAAASDEADDEQKPDADAS